MFSLIWKQIKWIESRDGAIGVGREYGKEGALTKTDYCI